MNPLSRIGVPNTSRQQDVYNPERPTGVITPIEETQPKFNAYRGTEMHGVETTDTAKPADVDYGSTEAVEYEEDTVEPDPIPVRIIQESKSERSVWRSFQIQLVNAQPMKLWTGDERVKRVRVTNVGNQSVATRLWVSSEQDPTQSGVPLVVHPGTTFPVPVSLDISEPTNYIWVECDEATPTAPLTVSVMVEYVTNV